MKGYKEPKVELMMRYFYEDEDMMRSEMTRSIGSINAQTYKNLMVTFCRDGGLDAHELISDICKVEWRSIGSGRNMGRGFALNSLLTVIAGDYFALLDSDDFMEPKFVEWCVSAAHDFRLVIVRPHVKLVYFKVEREKIDLFDYYFEALLRNGDAFYKEMFGEDSVKIFPSGLQMISNMFHRCLAPIRTKADLNITEDNYWMYKANRIVKRLKLRTKSFVPQAGGFYLQVHPSNRMDRYRELGLVMKAEDHYEDPEVSEIKGVKNAVPKRFR